ncbi:MAG: hypothetical protein K2X77_22850 [Candidatus Obscuribacterales bacterium]|jgi:hypothetical protein|nr:hypothetical protein [Candidatus Obscuribacterales bacterium]
MSVKRNLFTHLFFSALAIAAVSLPVNAAGGGPSPNVPSLEEIQAKRQEIREKLMLPSLVGLKSLAYRVVGYKDYQPLEKAMAGKLKQLGIRIEPVMGMKNDRSCDALAQITFVKTGAHTIGELKVTQWVTLDRDPRIHVKAVTYSEKAYVIGNRAESVVNDLTQQLVVDCLKANQKSFVIPHLDTTKAPAKK